MKKSEMLARGGIEFEIGGKKRVLYANFDALAALEREFRSEDFRGGPCANIDEFMVPIAPDNTDGIHRIAVLIRALLTHDSSFKLTVEQIRDEILGSSIHPYIAAREAYFTVMAAFMRQTVDDIRRLNDQILRAAEDTEKADPLA